MSAEPTRRDFLRLGAGLGGGLVLELFLPGCAPARYPVQTTARPGDFVPNAWLRITPADQVVFTLDRVEMGQGTMTSHAQLVAEELPIALDRIVVELAPANRAYDVLGGQITGGSASVKTSYLPLRRAAATARELLVAAAARRWGVDKAGCNAVDGAILHAASGKSARYGDLAGDAAREEVPSEVSIKSPEHFQVLGKSAPRIDAPAKVDGSAVYGIDVSVPGMVNALVLRPPALGAKVVRFDANEALREPGMVAVVAIPQGVAVVAHRYWQARRAAPKVRVEWTAGETWVDSAALFESYRARARRPATAVRSEGNVTRAERDAARVLEAVYELPYLAHAPLEPQNATAHVTEGRCEVWAPTQCPGPARECVRRVLGLPYDAITIHQTFVGGGFGRRLVQDYVEEAVQVSLRVKRPVKVLFSREDDMRHSLYRPMVVSLLRGSIGKDGSVTSWMHRIVAQSILAQTGPDWAAILPDAVPMTTKLAAIRAAGSIFGGNGIPDPTSVEGANTVAYAIPNLRVEYAPVVHPVPVGAWRSVGASHTVFAVESFLDELAFAARRDPLALRRELLSHAPRDRAVLDLASAKAGWGQPLPAGRARGIAQSKAFDTYCAHVAEVSVEGGTVKVHRIVSAIDCGIVVNPGLVGSQVQGAIAFGLGAALKQEITWKGGAVEQGNFDGFEPLRLHEMPDVEVHIMPSKEAPSGVGEPGVPPVAPAVANAVFAATGRRLRVLPFKRAMAAGAIVLFAVGRGAEAQPAPAATSEFLPIARVLQSPRCQNCHPKDDAPHVGDLGRRHAMNVSRRSPPAGLPCSTCHRTGNAPFVHGPPGLPGWRMPSAEVPMVFQGRTPHELCEQLVDPAQNGGKSLEGLREHFDKDPLVLWGWSPGPGRTPPPMSHEELMGHVDAWIAAGGPCPP